MQAVAVGTIVIIRFIRARNFVFFSEVLTWYHLTQERTNLKSFETLFTQNDLDR
jgi:hypothetical protein